ncbi:glycosyltransferase [Polaribacter sp. L3A8]|uniref:glycosyltransferase n=1 Tax=Polaribacter sp. L3A8 TaxID=2686361 RepID=UPI00131E9F33|nr:glycosyltransferase [Polaribacter sp. L3A8]
MKKKTILYITTDLLFLKNSFSGGAVVQKSHLSILLGLGYTIKILYVNTASFSNNKPQFISKNKTIFFENHPILVDELTLSLFDEKINFLRKIAKIICSPTAYYYKFINDQNNSFLNKYIEENNFHFVWAQWYYAGLLAVNLNITSFYVHHDWQYKLMKFKNKKSFKTSIITFSKKRIENKLIKNVDAIISVSGSDNKQFNELKYNSIYLPVTYNFNYIKKSTAKSTASLVHLGSLNTTANRVGLKNFLLTCWPSIKKQLPNVLLEIIGQMPDNDSKLIELLHKDKNIKVHGFVEDLTAVMHPYDIHLIPWNQDTGVRTRIPLIFYNKQCLVAMKNGVGGTAEITNNFNAILSDNWADYAKSIIKCYNDTDFRKELSNNGFNSYQENFSHESQFVRVKNFILKMKK